MLSTSGLIFKTEIKAPMGILMTNTVLRDLTILRDKSNLYPLRVLVHSTILLFPTLSGECDSLSWKSH